MTATSISRLRENARIFKKATKDQREQLRKNELNHIKELVRNYNTDLLNGELPINVTEMIGQLDRKVNIK